MFPWAFTLLIFTLDAFGILPMPYPVQPLVNELQSGGPVEVLRDPKSVSGYSELFSRSSLREMELPEFGNQPSALGYKGSETFSVPPALKPRVEFWKKIYTEYTTGQAVIHDTDMPEIVYGVVDISDIMNDPDLPYRKKMRLVNRQLKAEKEKVAQKLRFLSENQDNPLKIPQELFPLFRRFEADSNRGRFTQAITRIRAQIGQKDRIIRGFLYGGRYFHKMMEIFEKKKIPKELTRLTLVESAFNLAARSKVGASGVWQFMPGTGKRYMRIDRFVDERNDPIYATYAAAELLRFNFEQLNSWPLAITAYNHGPEGMARAVREVASSDLSVIISKYKERTFGFASSNFFSEFLAIIEVEREYRTYFGKILVDSPLSYEEISMTQNASFPEAAEACGIQEEELAILNPALTDAVVSGRLPVPEGYLLKIPPGKQEKCKSGFRNLSFMPVPNQSTLTKFQRKAR